MIISGLNFRDHLTKLNETLMLGGYKEFFFDWWIKPLDYTWLNSSFSNAIIKRAIFNWSQTFQTFSDKTNDMHAETSTNRNSWSRIYEEWYFTFINRFPMSKPVIVNYSSLRFKFIKLFTARKLKDSLKTIIDHIADETLWPLGADLHIRRWHKTDKLCKIWPSIESLR